MNKERFFRYFFIADMIIFFLAVGFLVGIYSDEWASGDLSFQTEKEILNISDCSNLSIDDTADCFVDYVRPFYNYTVRPDTEKTLEDVMENGGDCYDYSTLYKNMAEEVGVKGYTFSFYGGGKAGHQVAIIVDKKGYCLLDQISSPTCYRYAGGEDDTPRQRNETNSTITITPYEE